MGFLCLVYPWDVVLQAKSEGGNASGEVMQVGKLVSWVLELL